MTEYFDRIKSVGTIYLSDEHGDGQLADVRLAAYRFGEDVELVVAQFFKEHSNVNFSIVPVASYGSPPRSALCTKRSLEAALKTVSFEIGSRTEQQWRAMCAHHRVTWPARLTPRAA